jgi:sialate O-acetylesterase
MFPALIQSWRAAFGIPAAYFGFVQLSTWCKATDGIPRMRAAQMGALHLDDMIGYGTNADHGAGCNIHPPPKQYVGVRLGNSALGIVYKHPAHLHTWKSPSFAGQTAAPSQLAGAGAESLTLTINISDVSSELTADVYPWNYYEGNVPAGPRTHLFNCSANNGGVNGTVCGWAAILTSEGEWLNATVSVVGRAALQFTAVRSIDSAAAASDGLAVVGSSYGWAAVPMLSVYDRATMLPLLPWNTSVPVP